MSTDPTAAEPGPDRWPADGLTDGVVLVRAMTPDDVDPLVAALVDPEVRRWSPPNTRTDEQRREWAASLVGTPEDGPKGARVVVDAATGSWAGLVEWHRGGPPSFRLADVGYLLVPAARGRGLATRATRLLVDWLLDPRGLGLHRVEAGHAVEHPASCATATRAGLAAEGVRRSLLPLPAPDRPGEVVFHDLCQHGRVSPAEGG